MAVEYDTDDDAFGDASENYSAAVAAAGVEAAANVAAVAAAAFATAGTGAATSSSGPARGLHNVPPHAGRRGSAPQRSGAAASIGPNQHIIFDD